MSAPPATVDAYIATQPVEHRSTLEVVRDVVRSALPQAVETIAYGMPAYRTEGRHAVYFGGWKRHYALYPVSDTIKTRFAAELAAYGIEKNTVRFDWAAPVPAQLIAELARAIATS